GCSVYPRELVKAVLRHNAAAVVFSHNHPSGVAEPSSADRTLTERLKSALAQIDVRVLDHFVVGGTTCVSFAERGWI
ncbi:MAG: JAB domain-containing protein, partial [Nevskiaceae bacterium]